VVPRHDGHAAPWGIPGPRSIIKEPSFVVVCSTGPGVVSILVQSRTGFVRETDDEAFPKSHGDVPVKEDNVPPSIRCPIHTYESVPPLRSAQRGPERSPQSCQQLLLLRWFVTVLYHMDSHQCSLVLQGPSASRCTHSSRTRFSPERCHIQLCLMYAR